MEEAIIQCGEYLADVFSEHGTEILEDPNALYGILCDMAEDDEEKNVLQYVRRGAMSGVYSYVIDADDVERACHAAFRTLVDREYMSEEKAFMTMRVFLLALNNDDETISSLYSAEASDCTGRAISLFEQEQYADAAKELLKAVEMGCFIGIRNLWEVLRNNGYYDEALEIALAGCEKDDGESWSLLGETYLNLSERDDEADQRMIEAYERSHELGCLSGTVQLGILYKHGAGVNEDPNKAFQLFKMAADADDREGLIFLSSCYRDGVGVAPDGKKAIALLRRINEVHGEDGVAFREMGKIYQDGVGGIDQDYDAASECFEKAAEMGDAEASAYMGLMCYFGVVGEEDHDLAYQYLKYAAECGEVFAADKMLEYGMIDQEEYDSYVQ